MQHCKAFAVTLVSLPGSICSLPLESVVLVAGIWNFTVFLEIGEIRGVFFLKIFYFSTFTGTTRIWINTNNYHQPWLTTGKFTDIYIKRILTSMGNRTRALLNSRESHILCVWGGGRKGVSQNVRLFGFGDSGDHNFDVKRKQSQRIGMGSVTDMCKYQFLCFVTIIQVKLISGHQAKKVKSKGFRI